ncbi:sugar phosphate isomerase/epimerase family protein [Gordonia sp. LSe1-13]|uniref:Sugar phosphate isomerase/epimerase family protein n=1 Tax=Gordonia sesuvii TaxID=3116777 RepID=A0ABU7MCV0_9ACTN|nr:sugar phosphate isomerase/epimerase family protein [Gordonia sp. LSe1-13]
MKTTINKDILATCWTWAGDAAPARGDETSPVEIGRRIEAVAEAGWQGVGLVHADLTTIGAGIGLPKLKEILDANDITIVELEFITNWWADGEVKRESDRVRDELFEAAAILGARTVKTGAELQSFGATTGSVSLDVFAEKFDVLADVAGSHGVRVALEPMPMSNITTIDAGSDFIRTVGNRHGGLVVDTWHVARGGTDFGRLPEILPMEHVFVVELDDAPAEPVGTLWDDTCDRRQNPGEGQLDTVRFVEEMVRAGWKGHWGVEIIAEAQRRLPVEQAVQRTAAATRDVLSAAEKNLA